MSISLFLLYTDLLFNLLWVIYQGQTLFERLQNAGQIEVKQAQYKYVSCVCDWGYGAMWGYVAM